MCLFPDGIGECVQKKSEGNQTLNTDEVKRLTVERAVASLTCSVKPRSEILIRREEWKVTHEASSRASFVQFNSP